MHEPSPTDEAIVPSWLLEWVRCPISQTPLIQASRLLLERLGELHQQSSLVTRGGRNVSGVPTQGLVSGDGRWIYPVQDSIATLIPDEAIAIPKEAIENSIASEFPQPID